MGSLFHDVSELSIESILAICHADLPFFFALCIPTFCFDYFFVFAQKTHVAAQILGFLLLFFFVLLPNFIDNSNGIWVCVNSVVFSFLFCFFLFISCFWGISQNIVYFYSTRFCLAFASVCFSMNRNDLDSGHRRAWASFCLNNFYLKCVTKNIVGEDRNGKVFKARFWVITKTIL